MPDVLEVSGFYLLAMHMQNITNAYSVHKNIISLIVVSFHLKREMEAEILMRSEVH
jgi:hypothetical protein